MMSTRMGATVPHSAHVAAYCLIIVLALVPVFFPTIIWLVLAPMFLGLIEALMHFVGIKIMKREKFYTPGLVTAWVFLLPVSLYTIYFVLANNLAISLDWLFGLVYFIVCFGAMEVVIMRMTRKHQINI